MSPLPGAPLAAEQALDADNPFPGLLPFEERDAGFFFGRDAEKADLFERVRRDTLTVLFGRSGLGKTSLLRAGIFPLLREAGLLPIPVRLDLSERGGALRVQVQAAMREVIEAQAVEGPAPGAGQSLWEYFHATHFWGAGNRLLTPVLVIDQFEELFTLGQGDGRIGPFITELADLIENYIPASVRARIEASGEPLTFGYEQQNYRIVVCLREDYLPDLEALRGPIPSLGRNRVRLAHLDGRNALEAIVNPAPDLVSREVAAHIVRYVAGEPGTEHEVERGIESLEIDPAILSLVCRELNERRRVAGLPVITAELLAGARERILPDFYEEGLRDLPKAVRELVEDRLITGSGHRRAEALDDVLRAPGVTEEALSRLVDRRLLRREERLGIACIELTHDVLTKVVRESRDTRHAAELRRKRRRRALIAGTAVGALAAVAIVLAAVFANLYYDAEEQETLARKHREQAESLINFMLFDLRDRLKPLGRLDILEPAAKQALEYFDQSVGGEETPEAARKRSVALENIGDVWQAQGKRQAALDAYENALAIRERLAAQDPSNAGWQRDALVGYSRIGDVRWDEGDRKAALAAYEKSLAIAERLAAEDPGNAERQRDVSVSYERIGNVRRDEGDRKGALETYEKSLAIRERLAHQDPGNAERQRDVSVIYNHIGDVCRDEGDRKRALAAYEKSLAIAERLATEDPGNAGWQHGLSASYNRIGNVRRDEGDRKGALKAYEKSLAIIERLAAEDPDNANWQLDVSGIQGRIGDVRRDEGDRKGALEAYEKSLAIRERLAHQDPGNPGWQAEVSRSYFGIGDVHRDEGDWKRALAAYEKALAIRERLAAKDPDKANWQLDLANSFLSIGLVRSAEGDQVAAREAYAKFLAIYAKLKAKGISYPELDHLERLLQAPPVP